MHSLIWAQITNKERKMNVMKRFWKKKQLWHFRLDLFFFFDAYCRHFNLPGSVGFCPSGARDLPRQLCGRLGTWGNKKKSTPQLFKEWCVCWNSKRTLVLIVVGWQKPKFLVRCGVRYESRWVRHLSHRLTRHGTAKSSLNVSRI